jgi:hypothetical protein
LYLASNYLTGWTKGERYTQIDYDWESTPIEIKTSLVERWVVVHFFTAAGTEAGGLYANFDSREYTYRDGALFEIRRVVNCKTLNTD